MEMPFVMAGNASHDYQLGFEFGIIWLTMLKEREPAEFVTHIANADMLMSLADLVEMRIVSEELNDHWMKVKFEEYGND